MSAYDETGLRRVGPLAGAKVAELLKASGALDPGRPGASLESALAAEALASRAPRERTVGGDMLLRAVPMQAGDALAGAVVFGWRFARFPSSLGCQQIARQLGLDGVLLWAEARLESPLSVERLQVFAELLDTLVAAQLRHAQAIAQLTELAQLREVFLASVSHELRTPLQALAARTEVLLRSPPSDPGKLRLGLLQIRQHVGAQARLVEDLLVAARTRTGQMTLSKQPVALADVLDGAYAAVAPVAETRGIALRLPEVGDQGAARLRADPHRLEQVFWNLLSNAVKFTPPGGSVAVTVQCDAQECVVDVTDSGRGIEPELLPKVFEPFTRDSQGNAQGLGLGLSIARHIVELHDGSISAHSAGLGAGTTMRVRLPR